MKRCFLILVILAAVSASLSAQQTGKDSVQKNESGRDTGLPLPDSLSPTPRKSAVFAALLPAGGQIYNRDYWKVPLVLAALAAGTWTAVYWRVRYKDFVAGYFSFYDFKNPDSSGYGGLKPGLNADSKLPVFFRGGILNGPREEAKMMNIDQVRKYKDSYRRYFETAVVVTAAIYALTIIEANVAAHLKTFDISDDLTLKIEPKISQPLLRQPVAGIRFAFTFR
jgi:hypothetical protein